MKKPDVRLDAEDDPRQQGKIDHLPVDILVIALLAVIRGAETWSEIAVFGERMRSLLETLLPWVFRTLCGGGCAPLCASQLGHPSRPLQPMSTPGPP